MSRNYLLCQLSVVNEPWNQTSLFSSENPPLEQMFLSEMSWRVSADGDRENYRTQYIIISVFPALCFYRICLEV